MNALSRHVVLILLLWLLFFLAVWNLDTYPPIWFDEGIFLQAPKNLVLDGEYALREGDIFYRFSSYVTTGPPLLLPIALVFRLIGIDLWPGLQITMPTRSTYVIGIFPRRLLRHRLLAKPAPVRG